ncbi:PASTA domain-containing protein [Marinifilum caeruleilacunae]|uniref:PASTA domain-containing protein n=1 Tax=Marinifilum caeruleilacunae TaxID=2499076 RepID=A0ABX1X0X6_9BACT|nr:PASTA domain-containing protein [Marinifilum caeruleilacunae]NOU61866.1 PASTA domain-containing protein [Marinifilum caeruleilacunae]
MKSNHFFKSKFFLIQVGIALGITIVLVWITLSGLKWYTHHGEKLTVPNLYGRSLEEAEQKIDEENLRFTVYDSIYNPKYAPGTVLDQRPLAGAIVKRNRNLFLTINAHQPEQVRFPNLVDNSFRQAYELLITNGFKIGRLEYSKSQFFNLVLYPKHKGDSIGAGTMIDKGATIDLVLGRGNTFGVLAPNLMGKSNAQAKEKIILSNLNIGKVEFDESIVSHSDSLNAKVFKQYPSYNEDRKIRPGNNIDIWLTRDTLKLQQADSLLQQRLSKVLY